MPRKILILVRHADRASQDPRADSGLSANGENQARKILALYLQKYPNQIPCVWSSPKKRCKETVQPLVTAFGIEAEIHKGLDEAKSGFEKWFVFEKRVKDEIFLALESDHQIMILCSHGDWIPVALGHLIGTKLDVKKGSWVELHGEAKGMELMEIKQVL